MYLIIIDHQRIFKKEISEFPFLYEGIRIYKRGEIFLSLSEGWHFRDGEKTKRLQALSYEIYSEDSYAPLLLYVYEGHLSSDFRLYENTAFLLSRKSGSHILSRDPFLHKKYLLYRNGRLESNSREIFLNGRLYQGEELQAGDRVDLLSFSFIYEKDFLYIDEANADVFLKKYEIHPQVLRYVFREKEKEISYPAEKIEEIELEEVRPYIPYKAKNGLSLRNIIPALIMCLSMSFAASYNAFEAYRSGQETMRILMILIMPAGMFLSGVLLPLILYWRDKRETKREKEKTLQEYLDYLDEYELEMRKKLEGYEKDLQKDLFDASSRQQLKKDSLSFSLGTMRRYFPISFPECGEKTIRERYLLISQKAVLERCPLLLDMKDYRRVSILTRGRRGLFERFLLEASLRKEETIIALYAGERRLNEEIYHLPSLIHGEERYLLRNSKELQEFLSRSFAGEVLLMALEKVPVETDNDQVRILYFHPDTPMEKSGCIVDYSSSPCLYSSFRQPFTCAPEEDLRPALRALGKDLSFRMRERDLSLNDACPLSELRRRYHTKDKRLIARFAVTGNEIFSFDLHEKGSGPHGLIGGATGSGKSEFLISLCLSLCAAYPPDHLQLVLIDYKGGGLQNALSYEGRRLPHIIASLSDLENARFERLIYALKREAKKREEAFLRMSLSEKRQVADLDDYLDSADRDPTLPELAHLLIIVDEFAEMKKENPEYIRELISLARIGRSLGLHLLLATQKPGGVIDEEIWSNCRYKFALKVFEEKDSQEFLKRKDAAYLERPGDFCLLVDHSFLKGRSIYAKGDPEHEACRISLCDERLQELSSYEQKDPRFLPEIDRYLKEILKVCDEECPGERRLQYEEAEAVPADFRIPGSIVLGRKDDYIRGNREILAVKETETFFLYSSRDLEIHTLLRQCVSKPLLLLGKKVYERKNTAASLIYSEEEDIVFLLEEILEGNCRDHILIIEDLSLFLNYREDYAEILQKILKRREDLGLNVIALSSSLHVPYRLLASFPKLFLIGKTNDDELTLLFNKRPELSGKSFYREEEEVLPFTAAEEKGCEREDRKVKQAMRYIPEKIRMEEEGNKILLGYEVYRRRKVYVQKSGITVCAMEEKTMELYRRMGLVCRIYESGMKIDGDILWIGRGITRQRLFYCRENRELQDDEAYRYGRSFEGILKAVNDE